MESQPNVMTLVVGLAFVVFGVVFLWRSLHAESAGGKLKAMIERWGRGPGLWMYRVSYVGIPWLLGATMILAGINGKSIGAFFGS